MVRAVTIITERFPCFTEASTMCCGNRNRNRSRAVTVAIVSWRVRPTAIKRAADSYALQASSKRSLRSSIHCGSLALALATSCSGMWR